jgi:hypothetical protein
MPTQFVDKTPDPKLSNFDKFILRVENYAVVVPLTEIQ